MTSLLENKQLIHIGVEIAVLLGFTFYFSKKSTKLNEEIKTLTQRLDEQDEIIQKHETIIRKLVDYINNSTKLVSQPSSSRSSSVGTDDSYIKVSKKPKHTKPLFNGNVEEPATVNRVTFAQHVESRTFSDEEEDEDEDEYSDLDAEIAEELEELEEEETHHLKKNE